MSISMPRILFIDANLIMYSMGGPHPLRDPCKKFLEKINLVMMKLLIVLKIIYMPF